MILNRASCATTLIAFCFATAGVAQSAGDVTVTIDGEARVVPVWSAQSDWSGGENWPSINIYARTADDQEKEQLVMTLGFEAPRWDPDLPEMRVSVYENGELARKLYADGEDDRGGFTVTLDSHVVEGTKLSLSGSFEGTLGTSDNFGRDIDLSDGKPVTGSFDVTLEELD